MKKIIPICISLFLLFLVYELIVVFFVKEYSYTYDFKSEQGTSFTIVEEYGYKNKKHLYNIKIKNKKQKYNYILEHNYHKDKMIIESIHEYKKDNLTCIFPVFKDEVSTSPECMLEDKLVSYEYLKNTNNTIPELDKFLNKNNYNISHPNRETTELNGTALSLRYYNDIIKNYNILIWNYKGYFVINDKKQENKDAVNFDIYDSNYTGKTDDRYYIINALSDDPGFDTIYMINLKNGEIDKIDVTEYELSSNCYFNGSYKNYIYMIDRNTNKQYKIDPYKKELIVVSKENNIKYYDGKELKNMKLDSIANNNIHFNKGVSNKKITKLYNTEDIKKSNGHYYFKDNDGNFYMSFKDDYKNSLLLFNLKGLVEWSVVDDTIFGIYEDKLYAYNDKYGLYPIIIYNEFSYRKENMYAVSKK